MREKDSDGSPVQAAPQAYMMRSRMPKRGWDEGRHFDQLPERQRVFDDEGSAAYPVAFPAPPEVSNDESAPPKMVRIDLKKDPRVFAILDDGCNRTCHAPAFAKHLEQALQAEGKTMPKLAGESRRHSGIGGCSSTGRRGIPLGLALPDGSSVRAELMSSELSKSDERILLLSIKVQATPGIVKDARDGSCYLKDNGQYIPSTRSFAVT